MKTVSARYLAETLGVLKSFKALSLLLDVLGMTLDAWRHVARQEPARKPVRATLTQVNSQHGGVYQQTLCRQASEDRHLVTTRRTRPRLEAAERNPGLWAAAPRLVGPQATVPGDAAPLGGTRIQ